jgi:transposase-like protein
MASSDKGKSEIRLAQPAGANARGDDPLRVMMQEMVQSAIEREFEQHIGAGPWQRSPERRGWRNGNKRRRLKTRVGTLELRIPQDREGRFQPTLFTRYQRSEQALVLALIEMYLQGVSTRKVTHVVEELCGFGVSASQVSALVKRLDGELSAWRERSLSDWAYPFLVVDAHYEKVRMDGRVRSAAVLWVMGVREDGYREHLGVWVRATESSASWGAVFEELLGRGLRGVSYVVSDEHLGLREALGRWLPETAHQRCQVHYLRNLLGQAPSMERFQEAREALEDAWEAASREVAQAKMQAFLSGFESKSPRMAAWIEETVEETLAAFELPTGEERRRLRTTNGLEREHVEMRRRTSVVRIFPNEASLLRLASALAIQHNEIWLERRYLVLGEKAQLDRTWRRIRYSA